MNHDKLYKTIEKYLQNICEGVHCKDKKNNKGLKIFMKKLNKFHQRYYSWILPEMIRTTFLQIL